MSPLVWWKYEEVERGKNKDRVDQQHGDYGGKPGVRPREQDIDRAMVMAEREAKRRKVSGSRGEAIALLPPQRREQEQRGKESPGRDLGAPSLGN